MKDTRGGYRGGIPPSPRAAENERRRQERIRQERKSAFAGALAFFGVTAGSVVAVLVMIFFIAALVCGFAVCAAIILLVGDLVGFWDVVSWL